MIDCYKPLESKIKPHLRITICLLFLIGILIVTATVLFIVFSNYFNRVLFAVLLCVIDSLLIMTFFIVYDLMLVPVIKLKSHIKSLNKGDLQKISIKCRGFSEEQVSLEGNINCYKIFFKHGKEEKIFYLNALLENPFIEGKIYLLHVSQNFIVSYEEITND